MKLVRKNGAGPGRVERRSGALTGLTWLAGVLCHTVVYANSPGPASAPATNSQQAIEVMESREVAAVLANDLAALQQIWSDDLLVNAPNNRVARKSDILTMLRQQTGLQYGTFERHREAMLVKSTFVVTFGSELVTGKGGDGKAVTRRYTNVWHREGSQWRLVARQDSNVAPSP